MSIIAEYFALQQKYSKQYGERTVVLYHMGTFYETWGYNPSFCLTDEARIDKDGVEWTEIIGHSEELSVVLNSQLTQDNGNEPYSIRNPHKVGIPVISYEKGKRNLLLNDFTIVRIDQGSGTDAKGRQNRFVAEIISPTIEIDAQNNTRATSNIVCIYIEYQNRSPEYEDFLITTGISAVDIITGENRVCEFFSKEKDQVYAIQELFRFIKSHHPREVLLYVDDLPPGLDTHSEDVPNPYIKYLISTLELHRYDRLSVAVNDVKSDYKKPAFQTEFLNRIFTRKPGQSATPGVQLNVVKETNPRMIEDLGLERMNYGRIAYVILLQYCYSHNADIVTRLTKPDMKWIDENRHLILTHNAIEQLDVNPKAVVAIRSRKKHQEIDSLFTLLDHNQTALGRRALQSLLQNPMTEPQEISKHYDMVEEMLTVKIRGEDLWLALDKRLKGMADIGHFHRKLELRIINPKELAVLYKAYTGIVDIYRDVVSVDTPTLQKNMLSPEDVSNFNRFLARFSGLVKFSVLECCSVESIEGGGKWMKFKECPLVPGFYPEVDTQAAALAQSTAELQQIVDHLNLFLVKTKGEKLSIGKERKKKGSAAQHEGRTLLITSNAKAKTLLNSPIDLNLCGQLQSSAVTTSEQMVTSDRIMTLCKHIDEARNWLRRQLYSIYLAIIEEMGSAYNFYRPVAELVARLDLIHSYASVSFRNNYHKPRITAQGTDSYLVARELRHPIIEQLIDGAYVPNDISLGAASPENGHTTGMLLYGVNQTGKTSLAKAVGVAVIMAQAGCYTAGHLTYYPYRKLITRLSGGDNMFKGDSSYAVEMRELRTIDRQASANTLVIGDELCHGTETDSGQAITAAAVITLVQRRSSFIFATHMHELVQRSRIRALQAHELRISHLSVTRDDQAKVLIYDRKLAEGHGSSLYGAIVAEHLGMSTDFMNLAYDILHEVTGQNPQLVTPHKSRYHGEVYADVCAQCGKTRQEVELHTHHIQPQEMADERGLIGNMPKNKKGNLLVLCRACHTNLHAQKQELTAVTTAMGQLVVSAPE